MRHVRDHRAWSNRNRQGHGRGLPFALPDGRERPDLGPDRCWRCRGSGTVKAFDLTFSAPKSVSVLWALSSERVADVMMDATVRRSTPRSGPRGVRRRRPCWVDDVRRHVPTEGWAVAGSCTGPPEPVTPRSTHPLSRAECGAPRGRSVCGDRRPPDVRVSPRRRLGVSGRMQRLLSVRLGVEWQPDRSKRARSPASTATICDRSRAVEIETETRSQKHTYESPVLRMRADDEASPPARRRTSRRRRTCCSAVGRRKPPRSG